MFIRDILLHDLKADDPQVKNILSLIDIGKLSKILEVIFVAESRTNANFLEASEQDPKFR